VREENQDFEASMSHIARSCLKKTRVKKKEIANMKCKKAGIF
jgi:hypothetical protein